MDDTENNDDKPDEKAEGGESPSEERLEEVGQHIDRARSRAEEDVEGVEEHEERFADSGSEEAEDEDDQSIAPG